MSNGIDLGWVGFDLDGTIAKYDGWLGVDHVGDPIPSMLARVKAYLDAGREVKIVTARVSHPNDAAQAGAAVRAWCLLHLGVELEVTCQKDYRMAYLYDDRAVSVETNTGRILGGAR